MANVIKRLLPSGKTSYQVRFRTHGKKEICKSFKSQEEAEKYLSDLVDFKNNQNTCPKFHLDIWLDRYEHEELIKKSDHMQTSESRIIKYWREKLGNEIAMDLSSLKIEEAANCLYNTISFKGNPISPSTRRNYIICLNYIYEIALKKWKWCFYNPVLGVDRHLDKINDHKLKTKEKNHQFFDCKFKKEYADLCKEVIKNKSIQLSEIMKTMGYSKSSIQGLLDPEHNSSIFQMNHFANFLGLKLEISHA